MKLSRRDFLKVAGLALGGALATSESVLASSGGTDPNEYVAMLYDATMCVGCNACTNACRRKQNHGQKRMRDCYMMLLKSLGRYLT